jgi:hypothetical protein
MPCGIFLTGHGVCPIAIIFTFLYSQRPRDYQTTQKLLFCLFTKTLTKLNRYQRPTTIKSHQFAYLKFRVTILK